MELTRARLRKLLRYNPRTGIFTWLVDGYRNCVRAGDVAGGLTPDGRITIGIEGRRYLASRLAVLYMTGRWPRALVDHKNRDGSDNRWSNLREATSSQNLQNMRPKDSRSGLKGAIWDRGKYVARIRVNYRSVHLGRFVTAEEANAAYDKAAKKYFGEFARAR